MQSIKTMSYQIENISKEIEIFFFLKKNQVEMLELKSITGVYI